MDNLRWLQLFTDTKMRRDQLKYSIGDAQAINKIKVDCAHASLYTIAIAIATAEVGAAKRYNNSVIRWKLNKTTTSTVRRFVPGLGQLFMSIPHNTQCSIHFNNDPHIYPSWWDFLTSSSSSKLTSNNTAKALSLLLRTSIPSWRLRSDYTIICQRYL